MVTLPPAPTFAVTAFGIVCPATQFRLDTNGLGCGCPEGQMLRNEAADVFVTVTFSTTASALAGTPPTPATVTSRLVFGPQGVLNGPICGPLGRESSTRAGGSETKPSPAAVSYQPATSMITSTL